MKLLADENIPVGMVDGLRAFGHSVHWIAKSQPGLPDDEVLRRALLDHDLLFTEDKDFGELVFREGLTTAGVVLLRHSGWTTDRKTRYLQDCLELYADKLSHRFTVISKTKVRIRSASLEEEL